MSLTRSEKRIFEEACDGYGFREVDQTGDGIYCDGCCVTHKRPTKMYTNGRDVVCRYQVIRLWDPEKP